MKNEYNFILAQIRSSGFILISILWLSGFLNAQIVTYTFTNASATGSAGPTQAQVNAAYLSTNLNGLVSVSAGIQSWTVPSSGLYRVTAFGASSGQNSTANQPGLGAKMEGEFNLVSGDVLQILVGQMGENHPSYAAGGGGGSFVTKTPHNTLASILVIAGGGGAPSGDFPGLSAVTATCGTFDVQSGPAQCGGNGGISFSGNSGGGGGGFFTDGAGNATVANGGRAYINGGAGALTSNVYVRGGFGGGGGNASPATSTYASSGGGGFSGGNGGNRNSTVGTGRMGGGGGGSYNNGTNQVNSVLTTTGHGSVVITRLCNIALGTTIGNNLICNGAAVTLTTDAISSYSWSTGSNASSITVSPSVTTSYSLTAMSPSLCMTSAAITITVSNAAPSLSVSVSSPTVCLGNTVSISASGALTYSFSGGISNGVAFTPTATTAYTIQGQNGCGTASAVITITIAPLPVTGLANPSLVCAGNTASLSGGGASTYTWLPGNIVGTSIVVSPPASTTYTVVGATGNCLGVNTVVVNANPIPTITAMASNSLICEGETVTLTANGAISYTWQPVNLTGSSIVVTPTIPTAFTVYGENSFSCSSSVQIPVVVFPAPGINLVTNQPIICEGQSATLTASGANTYSWNTGATSSSIVVSPAATSIFTVVGTNTTSQCSSTKTIHVSVYISSLAISGPTGVCTGSSATLTANGAGSYSWSTGAIGNTIVVSPLVATGYSVNGLTVVGNITCPGSSSVMLAVNPLPTVSIVASTTIVCINYSQSTTFTASGAQTYTWSFVGPGSVISVTPSFNGFTTYSVIGTDQNGCQNLRSITVRGWICGGLSEDKYDTKSVQVFPNPSRENITVSSELNLELLLINELGQIIKEISLNPLNGNKATLKNLKPGLYFLRATNPQLKLNKKLVILE